MQWVAKSYSIAKKLPVSWLRTESPALPLYGRIRASTTATIPIGQHVTTSHCPVIIFGVANPTKALVKCKMQLVNIFERCMSSWRLLVGAWNKNMSIIVEYTCIIKKFRTETLMARMFTELCKGIKHVQESNKKQKQFWSWFTHQFAYDLGIHDDCFEKLALLPNPHHNSYSC